MPVFTVGPNIVGSSGNDFLIGLFNGPDHTFRGEDGNDVIYGDFAGFFNSVGNTASQGITSYNVNIGPFLFSTPWTRQENRDISNSTTVSHVMVAPTNLAGQQGWMSVTVIAGQTITLDVDYGRDTNNTDTDTVLRIYQSDGTTLLAENNDSVALDVGSTSTSDSFLTYTFATAGTYLINISEYNSQSAPDGGVFEANDDFLLHVSLTGQEFAADPDSGVDYISGGNGDDTLYGFGGNDELNGGAGADVLDGGAGSDRASYQGASIGVYARLDGIAGASGDAIGDVYISIEGLSGSRFDDVFVGNSGANSLIGYDGSDTLYGLGGTDTLQGGDGNDIIYGGFGPADPTDATDTIYGNAGNDLIYGNAGDDVIYGGENTDAIYGGLGSDTIYGGLGAADPTDATDTIYGNAGNDLIYGNAGDDFIYGGEDTDSIYGGLGSDTIYGGLAAADPTDATDTIYGNAGNDLIYGNGGDDFIYGNEDNDTIYGGAGLDRIAGGTGNDILYGNADADRFIFDSALNASTNVDAITDFQTNIDDIELSQAIFLGIGEALDASEFISNAAGTATLNTQRIIYNSTTGQLYYDSDGSGAGAATLFATLTVGTVLTIDDFVTAG